MAKAQQSEAMFELRKLPRDAYWKRMLILAEVLAEDFLSN